MEFSDGDGELPRSRKGKGGKKGQTKKSLGHHGGVLHHQKAKPVQAPHLPIHFWLPAAPPTVVLWGCGRWELADPGITEQVQLKLRLDDIQRDLAMPNCGVDPSDPNRSVQSRSYLFPTRNV